MAQQLVLALPAADGCGATYGLHDPTRGKDFVQRCIVTGSLYKVYQHRNVFRQGARPNCKE